MSKDCKDWVLSKARDLVYGSRGKTYGPPAIHLGRTGKLWGAILGTDPIPPEKVAMMYICDKMSRLCNTKDHMDSVVDIAGYAEVYWRIMEENGKT